MSDIQSLIKVTERLLDKETGCPWDLVQTHESLCKHTIEEVHELLHAIAINDSENIKEELGDLLFQIVFYAKIAEENGQFTFADVIQNVSDKLIRRHPHIFADKTYDSLEAQQADWQRIKAEEKTHAGNNQSLLNDSYQTLPSIEQSVYFQKVAAKLGFDWQTANEVIPKIHEEVDELLQEINQPQQQQSKIEEEYGDLLFACLNLGRQLKIDSDLALRKANQKFISRFEKMIAQVGNQETFKQLSLDDKENLWQQVKQLSND